MEGSGLVHLLSLLDVVLIVWEGWCSNDSLYIHTVVDSLINCASEVILFNRLVDNYSLECVFFGLVTLNIIP